MSNKSGEKFLAKITKLISKELYHQLVCVSLYMSIDLKCVMRDCGTDYDKFWALINKYYNDYMEAR